MDYSQSIEYIHSLEKFGIKPGLERIAALSRAFGNPQERLPFIHVAGTNGKGSTSTMLSRIFAEAGYKTGLFISPYVIDFCERIQIDNEMISHERLAQTITTLKPVVEKMRCSGEPPTEFEVLTAAAFVCFSEENCDIAVLEVGLGGRLDSTNIIPVPLASVIASISLDHTAILGDTVEEIASEKCGIIKEGGITVSYPCQQTEAAEVIKASAKLRRNRLIIPDIDKAVIIGESLYGTDAVIGDIGVHIPFMGNHMVYNAATAIEAAKAISGDCKNSFSVSSGDISLGIAKASMPARMEIIEGDPIVIIDGGHNEGCANALKSAIEKYLGDKKITAICGLMADKDYEKYLSTVAPLFENIITVTPPNPRALSAHELAEAAAKYCSNVYAAGSFSEAAKEAKESGAQVIAVCGSFYMVSSIKPFFEKN